MSNVVVTAMIQIEAGKEQRFEAALATLCKATRAEEGCLSYVPHRTAEPGHYCILESWRSQEDLDLHSFSDHLSAFRETTHQMMIDSDVVVWQPFCECKPD